MCGVTGIGEQCGRVYFFSSPERVICLFFFRGSWVVWYMLFLRVGFPSLFKTVGLWGCICM